jgi:hypothetical protein
MTGPEAQPLDVLRTMIAGCATFQAWLGIDPERPAEERLAEAKQRVYVVSATLPARPFALIGFGSRWAARRIADAYAYSGSAFLQLAKDIQEDEGGDQDAAFLAFVRDAGEIVEELFAQAGGDGTLRFEEISRSKAPGMGSLESDATKGEYAFVEYALQWG